MAKRGDHGPRPSVAAVKGHPIHPMLIPFPIAFLSLLPVTDVAYVISGDLFWPRASYYLVWAGLGAGALAALAGLVDFITIRRARRHRQGWLHLATAIGALTVATVNALHRVDDPVVAIAPAGLLMSVVTLGLLGFAGWYGGELSYRHEIGVAGHGEPEEAEEAKPKPQPQPARAVKHPG